MYKIATPELDKVIEQIDRAMVSEFVFTRVDPIWFDLNAALKEIRSLISEVKQLEPKAGRDE